jgi:hypothetical protein
MTAEEHNKTLSTLYFIYGAIHGLTLLGLLGLVLIFKFASVAGELISSSWMIIGSIAFVVLSFVVGLLPALVGFGFARRRRWVRPLSIVLAIVSLVNIPIGTALGIYTIKFLRSEGGVKLYGGQARANEQELQEALGRARPLMNLAERLK